MVADVWARRREDEVAFHVHRCRDAGQGLGANRVRCTGSTLRSRDSAHLDSNDALDDED